MCPTHLPVLRIPSSGLPTRTSSSPTSCGSCPSWPTSTTTTWSTGSKGEAGTRRRGWEAALMAAVVMSPLPPPPPHSYPRDHFRALVEKVNLFISVRLFPPHPGDLPPPPKCAWWIPSAIKVLAVLSKWREWSQVRPCAHSLPFPSPSLPLPCRCC